MTKADQVLAALREARWRSIDSFKPHNEHHLRAYLDCGHHVYVTKYWYATARHWSDDWPSINCLKCP